MDPSTQIREAIAHVAALRVAQAEQPQRRDALLSVKRIQAQRFRATHADLLADARHGPASRFFLDELYSERDYTQRDAQFTRIAEALQRFFPARVVQTAVLMSNLHRLTESLDDAMAQAWQAQDASLSYAQRYALSWRSVGEYQKRSLQLVEVLKLGHDLDQLTRTPGLRMALRLMRKPAASAGLAELQAFLERGFDTFAAMGGANVFLNSVRSRESRWINTLGKATFADCVDALQLALNSGCETQTP